MQPVTPMTALNPTKALGLMPQSSKNRVLLETYFLAIHLD